MVFEWSKYMQTKEFLEASRIMLLPEDFRPLVKKWLGLQDGMRVLDVGCGTGLFSQYLAAVTKDCEYTGIDIDAHFIAGAKEKAEGKEGNSFKYIVADALDLPFSGKQFDLVVSLAALTNIGEPVAALKEMRRVVKPGGLVASLTAQSLKVIPIGTGRYPPSHKHYYFQLAQMTERVLKAYEKMIPKTEFFRGVEAEEVPRLFVSAGLWNICMYALGRGFSLSNAAMDDREKARYIELNYIAELDKFNAYARLDGFEAYLSGEDCDSYRALLRMRRDALLAEVGENAVWEWYGGGSFVMTGVAPLL